MAAESGRKYKHDILIQKVYEGGWIHQYMYSVYLKYHGFYSCSPKQAVTVRGSYWGPLAARNNVTAVEISSSDLFFYL